MKQRRSLKWAAVVIAGIFFQPAMADNALRVCADPDNLPFSKAEGPERGLYIELADLVAKNMQAEVTYSWWLSTYQKKALRNTLLAGDCDVYFALPADASYMGKSIARTRAFLNLNYAVVASPTFKFSSLADLKGKRIAVQLATPPHLLLVSRDGFSLTTFPNVNEALDALAKGEVDAAFVWGAVAGYENKKRFNGTLQVTPVIGSHLSGQVAVGVRKGNDALLASLDRALTGLEPDIARLADKYGFTTRAVPVNLDAVAVERIASPAVIKTAAPTTPPVVIKAADNTNSAVVAAPAAKGGMPASAAMVNSGREVFNSRCGYCHTPNATSPIPERDLRRQKNRYGDKWRESTTTTINEGRLDKGMPTWKGTLSDNDINLILEFLGSVQR